MTRKGLLNGIGGTVWTWPNPPETPRDVIAGHVRNWGRELAYDLADTLIAELTLRGFHITRVPTALRAPALPSEEEMRSKILDLIESRPMNGLNAEGNYVESIYWAQRGYINGLRAVLALFAKSKGCT